MAKRFTDTEKYKKPFIRSLPGAYKLFWDYLYHECNHAGIWIVDFEIAQIYLGNDLTIDKYKALDLFNSDEQRITELSDGKKWFIKPFIQFQYGELNPENRAHNSVIQLLKQEGLYENNKGLIRGLQGRKDKDKDMDTVKDKDKESKISKIYQEYPRKVAPKKAKEKIEIALRENDFEFLLDRVQQYAKCVNGSEKQFIPYPATWFHQERFNDDPKEWVAQKEDKENSPTYHNYI